MSYERYYARRPSKGTRKENAKSSKKLLHI